MPPESAKTRTVLVIDDVAAVRSTIVEQLKRAGFHAMEAADGSEAIHLFAAHSQEIVAATLDLDMPTTNGRETLAMLSEVAPFLPILVVTAWPIDQLSGRIPGTPGVAYLAKPFTSEQLIKGLERVMGEMGRKRPE